MFTKKDKDNLAKFGNYGISATVEKIHQVGNNNMVFFIQSNELKSKNNPEGKLELIASMSRFSAASFKGKKCDITYNKKRNEILGIKSTSEDGVYSGPVEV